ncbi:hypothetical protein ACFLUJ_08130 [Chloroflexota bacterium]
MTEARKDYQDKCHFLTNIPKSPFVSMTDLVLFVDTPLEVECIELSGYDWSKESLRH